MILKIDPAAAAAQARDGPARRSSDFLPHRADALIIVG
jgi:hypothetical protein